MSETMLDGRDVWKSELELKAQALKRMEALKQQGAPIRISSNTTENVLSGALDIIEGRGWLDSEDNLYKPADDAIVMLEYYANSIAHWRKEQCD